MKDFISDEARERLIKANADCSSDIGAVLVRKHVENVANHRIIEMVICDLVDVDDQSVFEEKVA